MDPNALSLLRQLAENPGMVSQLQGVLSMLNVSSSNLTTHGGPTSSSSVLSQSDGGSSASTLPSPAVTLVSSRPARHPTDRRSGATTGGGAKPAGRQPPSSPPQREHAAATPMVSALQYEDLEARLRAADSARREQQHIAREAEGRVEATVKELQRLQRSVDQLTETVQEQRRRLSDVEQQRSLEVEELKQTYEAVIRRKDEVHQEAMRQLQLLRTRQLYDTAKKYEAAVERGSTAAAAARLPQDRPGTWMGETAGRPISRDRGSGDKVVKNSTATNTAVKREREAEGVVDRLLVEYAPPSQAAAAHGSSALYRQPRRLSLSDRDPNARCLARNPRDATVTTPKPYSTSATLLTRTTSRKRRTPRTPSLTHADRMHSCSQSPAPPMPTTLAASATAHHLRTVSGRSNTLSPGVHAAPAVTRFVAQYSNQIGTTPVNKALPPTAAIGRHAHASQLSQLPRPVPSTLSGPSSVAAGPTRSPSPVDPQRGLAFARRFIFTGLKDNETDALRAAIEAIGDEAEVIAGGLDEPPPLSCTHILVRGTPRSVKALCGLVSGKWLVPPDYVFRSQQQGFWLDEYEEGGLRVSPPPLKGQRFLLSVDPTGIREKLAQVIEYGGGEVVTGHAAGVRPWTAEGVIVITSGDDLLRYAMQPQS